MIQTWVSVLLDSMQLLWMQLLSFLPALVGALIIFVIGLVVASVLEKLVERVVYHVKLDHLLRQLGLEMYMQRASLSLDSGHFFGKIVYWFVFLSFILASSNILGFVALSKFIGDVLFYIPNVIVAVLIMIVALVAANFLRKLTLTSVISARLHKGKFLGSLVWWAVFIFGLMVSLVQLGVATTIIETVVAGLIAMFALAGGLAFGLGGKEVAGHLLEKVMKEWEHTG